NTIGDLHKVFDLHHDNYKKSDNSLSNLKLAHRTSNLQHINNKGKRTHAVGHDHESEQDHVAATHASANAENRAYGRAHGDTLEYTSTGAGGGSSPESNGWSSTEGERHDKLRTAYDKTILDMRNGPFAIRQDNPK